MNVQDEELLSFGKESIGFSTALNNQRTHLIDINSQIIEGRFEAFWGYSRCYYNQQTIEKLAEKFIENLKILITHCTQAEMTTYTPSDFPLAKVSQLELEEVLKKYRG